MPYSWLLPHGLKRPALGGWLVVLTAFLLAFAAPVIAQEELQRGRDKAEEKKDEEAEKKPPLEIGRLAPRFGDPVIDLAVDEGPTFSIKPGHWTAAIQPMQANYNDFIGQFAAEVVDDSGRVVPLDHTQFAFKTIRQVTLAKGKQREIESELFLPQYTTGTRLDARLVDRDSGSTVYEFRPKLAPMPAYQYHLVVVASEPAKYSFLKVTDTVRAPWEEEFTESSSAHYQVSLLRAGAVVPLPENPLTWTSVAYLFWDEVDPTQLTSAQQKALVDWLHWGGRLIVNGPDSLSQLQGSFLDQYIPAEDGGPREIGADELAALSAYWGEREQATELEPIEPRQPFSGINLVPRDRSTEFPRTGGLFAMSRVGRGIIIVSAFQLVERSFVDWPGFDGFLNGALLGRPARIFTKGPLGGEQVDWARYPQRRLDAHFTTPLRLFARDSQAAANTRRVVSTTTNPLGIVEEVDELAVDRPGGVAAWDEFSPAAQVVREILLTAAGVRVPGAMFVLGCLAFYLLVLVPVNWLIFHTIEHVEWAWIAVPFIAVAGTWAVVKQAQLDIGFVRAQTEVAILELYGGHERGVLSRFTALYSSLATTYEIEFPDQPSAAVLPFPASGEDRSRWEATVVFDQSNAPRLNGLTISSSATRLVHVEQVTNLKGPITLGRSSQGFEQVENHTEYDLRDVAVIRRKFNDQGEPHYDAIWLGDLRQGKSAVLGLTLLSWNGRDLVFAAERDREARDRTTPAMGVDSLIQLAFTFDDKVDPLSKRDEVRLVGVIDGAISGMEVTPEASQRQGATVVVAHLDYGWPVPPRPDVNSPSDVISMQTEIESP